MHALVAVHTDNLALQATRPSAELLLARNEALEQIRQAMASYTTGIASRPTCEVAVFGSTLIGVDDEKSDLDLTVLVRGGCITPYTHNVSCRILTCRPASRPGSTIVRPLRVSPAHGSQSPTHP